MACHNVGHALVCCPGDMDPLLFGRPAMREVNAYNGPLSWARLMALPKMVLTTPECGGKKHKQHHEAGTRPRCRRWLEGETPREVVVVGCPSASPEGCFFSGGCGPLLQRLERVLADTSEKLLVQMREKHPVARPEDEVARDGWRSVRHSAAL
eukprot:2643822-Amphidinium_carterae.2